VLSLKDTTNAASVTLNYGVPDRDRICRVEYGTATGGTCNVLYDALGNMISAPTRTAVRQSSYFLSGSVRNISSQGVHAAFAYDPFGQVHALDLQGAGVENRRDRRYGRLIEQRDVVDGNATMSQIVRQIPWSGGILATRRGPTSNWVFQFGERRGSRFFLNRAGEFIQETDYQPFGESTSTGAGPSTRDHTKYQWNVGDTIAALGLSHLGARIYDPVIGRFLSRDPLLVPKTATTTNPYAFAINEPLNASDPTGLDCYEQECQGQAEISLGLIPLPPGWPNGSGTPSAPATQQQAPNLQVITLPWGATVGGITIGPSLYTPRLADAYEFLDPSYWEWHANPFNYFQRGWTPLRWNWNSDRSAWGTTPPWIRTLYDDQKEMEALARSIWGRAFDVVNWASILVPLAGEYVAWRLAANAIERIVVARSTVNAGKIAAQFEKAFGVQPDAIYLVGSQAERALGNAAVGGAASDIDLFFQTSLKLSKHEGAGFEFFIELNPGRVPAGVTGIGPGPGRLFIGGAGGIPKPGLIDPFFGPADALIPGAPAIRLIW
jgi:RHS repeat-associated protein